MNTFEPALDPALEGRAAPALDADVVVIGSGFGGAVAALRFAEAGAKVAVLERGPWVKRDEFVGDLGFFWLPDRNRFGMNDIRSRGRTIMPWLGAGVGGGSHVYAGTLKRCDDWTGFPAAITGQEMARWYDVAASACLRGADPALLFDFGRRCDSEAPAFARMDSGALFAPIRGMRIPLIASSLVAALTVASVLSAPRLAFAGPLLAVQPEPLAPPSSQPVREGATAEDTVWYGWQNLGTDAASIALVVAAMHSDETFGEGLALLGVGVYAFGSPVIHAAHGHGRRAAGSVALRLGLPLVAGAFGAALAPECPPDSYLCFNALGGAALGGLIGAGGAVLIDDLGLATEVRPATRSWAPTLAPTRGGGMSVGVAGTF